jgi:TRAP-type mannitol/chloroaromatic compound transport system substrate-binding protein
LKWLANFGPISPQVKCLNEFYAELSSQNATFKRLYDHLVAFRNEEYFWFQVAEFSFDAFQVRFRTKT